MPATAVKSKSMKMSDIRDKARGLGITPGKAKKVDLVHWIQSSEGNPQCYGCSSGYCDQSACCFMGDCLRTNL